MAAYLDRDQLRLYTLIWERMVASQMSDALLEATHRGNRRPLRGPLGQRVPFPRHRLRAQVPRLPRRLSRRTRRCRRR